MASQAWIVATMAGIPAAVVGTATLSSITSGATRAVCAVEEYRRGGSCHPVTEGDT